MNPTAQWSPHAPRLRHQPRRWKPSRPSRPQLIQSRTRVQPTRHRQLYRRPHQGRDRLAPSRSSPPQCSRSSRSRSSCLQSRSPTS